MHHRGQIFRAVRAGEEWLVLQQCAHLGLLGRLPAAFAILLRSDDGITHVGAFEHDDRNASLETLLHVVVAFGVVADEDGQDAALRLRLLRAAAVSDSGGQLEFEVRLLAPFVADILASLLRCRGLLCTLAKQDEVSMPVRQLVPLLLHRVDARVDHLVLRGNSDQRCIFAQSEFFDAAAYT